MTKREVVSSLVKSVVAVVPLVGGSAAEFLDIVLRPAVERRREEWFAQLVELLNSILDRFEGFDPGALCDDERFVSAVIEATIVAAKTHDEDKRRALANAVVNTLMPGAPDEFEQVLFRRYIDELQALHLRALAVLAEPRKWLNERGWPRFRWTIAGRDVGPRPEWGIPELAGQEDLADLLLSDLAIRGLIVRSDQPNGIDDGKTREFSTQVTDLGGRFLRVVSDPLTAIGPDRAIVSGPPLHSDRRTER